MEFVRHADLISAILSHKDSDAGIEFVHRRDLESQTNYREFIQQALKLRQSLLQHGLKAGDELVIVSDDVEYFSLYFIAAILASIIPVPLAFPSTGAAKDKVEAVWRQLRNPWITSERPLQDIFISSIPGAEVELTKRIIQADELDELQLNGFPDAASPEQLAFIQYSSGSTGDPKGVQVTHQMLVADCESVVRSFRITNQDRFLSWMPLSHDFGVIYFFLFPLICGLSFTLMPTRLFSRAPVLWLEKMNQRRATISGAPNYAFEHVMKMFKADAAQHWNLNHIRCIISGAEPIDSEICQRFEATMAPYGLAKGSVTPAYGLAEATLLVSSADLGKEVAVVQCDREFLKPGDLIQESDGGCAFVNVGRPIAHVQLRISDDSCVPYADNRIGRIQLQGDIVTPGYYFLPNRTEELFSADGWLETGDLGFVRDGNLVITGRSKDVIIINGKNFYPQDIESICASLPELGLNKVIACSAQDKSGKARLLIFLLFRRGEKEFLPLAQKVEELLLRQLDIKPDHCLPISRVPKTTSGKLMRFELVKEFEQGAFDKQIERLAQVEAASHLHPLKHSVLTGKQADTVAQLTELILPLTQFSELSIDKPLMEQGFKSIHLTEVIARINAALGTQFPVSMLFDSPTIQALATELLNRSNMLTTELSHQSSHGSAEALGVIGIGCELPGSVNSAEAFWQSLLDGNELVGNMPADRKSAGLHLSERFPGLTRGYFIDSPWSFDNSFFNITPAEALAMDPQQRLLLECCWHAFEDAGIDPGDWRGKKVGVYLGLTNIDYNNILRRSGDPDAVDAYRLTGSSASVAAGRIAYFFNFQGPVFTVDTACSSSLVAAHQAMRDLQAGDCELALVGGANLILDDSTSAALTSMKALSATGQSKAFSASADGYGRGEGCVVMLLRRQSEAEAESNPVRALLKGSAINHDGASNGLTAPSGKAQQQVIRQALESANCSFEQLRFIEAHGTGTILGDPVEVDAISQVFAGNRNPTLLSSVKTQIGHLEAAAGVAGLLKAILALQHRHLPANKHANELNPHINWPELPVKVAQQAQSLPADDCYAGVSAFGLSGTNCHVILQAYQQATIKQQETEQNETWPGLCLPLSAKSQESLQLLAGHWQDRLAHCDEHEALKLCAAAALNRPHLEYRELFYAWDKDGLLSKLGHFDRAQEPVNVDRCELAFIFAGQGCQYPAMAAALYQRYPLFRDSLQQMASVLKPVWPHDLITLLTDEKVAPELLNETSVTQVLVVAWEIAMARLWQHWGATPDFCVGHSVGEIAAAVICESLSVKEAMQLVAARGRIIAALPAGGAMAAVAADRQSVQAAIDSLGCGEELVIAAHNSPLSQTISGQEEALKACQALLSQSGIQSRRLSISHAFHSPLMVEAINDFSAVVSKIAFRQPSYPVISTVTGKLLTDADWQTPEYWLNHLVQPVLFNEAINLLPGAERLTVIEIAPKPTLMSVGKQCRPEFDWICSQSRAGEAMPEAEALARLYRSGANLNWHNVYNNQKREYPPLPLYPFRKLTYRPEEIESAAAESRIESAQPKIKPKADVAGDVRELLLSVSGLSETHLEPDANWYALGLDSLVIVQIQQAILKRFGIEFELGSLLGELDTCHKLTEKLGELLPQEQASEGSPEAFTKDTELADSVDGADPFQALCQQQIRAMNALFESQLKALGGSSATTTAEPLNPRPSTQPAREIKGLYQAVKTEKELTLTKAQQGHLLWLQSELNQKTSASKSYTARYRDSYANSRSIIGFKPETKELAYPVHVEKAEGIYLWDLDGNRYIDITMGFGSILFGHNPDFIKQALVDSLENGAPVGPQNLQAGRVAEKLCRMTGNERAAFFTTGTEAIMVAVRIARSVTRRPKIVIFQGAFHGSFDAVLASGWLEGDEPQTVPLTDGSPQSLVEDTIVLNYGDERALQVIEQHAESIAAVLIEPVQSRNPALQPVEFVRDLRRVTEQRDIALICDDIILGFRYAPDGSQSWLGIKPDLVTYGKVLGGGQPIGVLAGTRRYMDAVDGGSWNYGDDSVPQHRTSFVAGTFNNHPLAMSAADAVLDKLASEGEQLQQQLNQRTESMCRRLNDWFEQNQLPIAMVWFGSLFRFDYSGSTDLLSFHLLKNGLYVWEGRNCFLGAAHTDEDIREIISIIKRSVWELVHGGWLEGLNCENQAVELPLSEGQKAMRFLLESQPERASAYSEMMALEFNQTLDYAVLQQAWGLIIERHESLRVVRFSEQHQYVAASVDPVIAEGRVIDEQQRMAARQQLLAQPFDLAWGPFWQVQLLETPAGSDLLFCFSHMIADGWSMGIVVSELAEVYQKLMAGKQPELPPVTPLMQYLTQQSCIQQEPQAQIKEATPSSLNIFGDGQPFAAVAEKGFRLQTQIEPLLFEQVTVSAQRQKVTPFTLLLASWAVLLNRLSGQQQLVVGMPVAGHGIVGGGHLVGHTSEVYPVEIPLSMEQRQGEFVQQVSEAIIQTRQAGVSGKASVTNLFNLDRAISVSFDGTPAWGLVPLCAVKQPLFLNILEFNGRLTIDFDVNSEIASEAMAQRWLADYLNIVNELCSDDERTLAQLARVIAPEQSEVVDGQGVPLLSGALGWHESESGKYVARINASGQPEKIAPAQQAVTHLDLPVCSQLLLPLMNMQADDVKTELYQGELALMVTDPQHPLAQDPLATLAGKFDQAIAKPWQPVYLKVGEGSDYLVIRQQKSAVSESEIKIAQIWQEVIGLQSLPPVNESFINLGGNSLQALSAIHKLHAQLQLTIDVSDFLQAPGIETLVEMPDPSGPMKLPLVSAPSQEEGSPCSNNQQRLLFLQSLEPELCAYNVGFSVSSTRAFNMDALEHCVATLAKRHSVLSCCFKEQQYAHPVAVEPQEIISFVELENLEEAEADAQAQVSIPFKLDSSPAWRIHLQQLPEQSRLIVTLHHVICDLWSVEILCAELLGLLKQHHHGYQLELPPLALRYADFARAMNLYQSSEAYSAELDSYTRCLLPTPPAIDLSPDGVREPVRSICGDSLSLLLSSGMSQQLRQLSRHRGYSLYSITLAALALLVNQQQGAEKMILGAVTAQRNQPESAELPGFFANTLAVKLELAGCKSINRLIEYCAAQMNQALRFGHLTLDRVIQQLGVTPEPGRQPLLDVVLVMDERDTLERLAESHDVSVQEIPVKQNQFDFTLYVSYSSSGIRLHALYNSQLYSQARVSELLAALKQIFTDIATEPDRALSLNSNRYYELSAQQQRLWFVDAFENGVLYQAAPTYYNMPYRVELPGGVERARLQRSLQECAGRQPVLNYRLRASVQQAEQGAHWVSVAAQPVELRVVKCLPDEVQKCLDECCAAPFDLASEPLLRAVLVDSGSESGTILQLTAHHMIADKTALRRFASSVLAHYQSPEMGLPDVETESAFTAKMLSKQQREKQLSYWKEQLSLLVPLQLPEDIPRQTVHIYHGEQLSTTVHGLGQLANRLGCSQRALALALFHLLLHRYSRQQDIATGMVLPAEPCGQDLLKAEDALVVIRSLPDEESSLKSCAHQIEKLVGQAEAHSSVEFDEVVLAVNPDNDMSRTALFDVLFLFEQELESAWGREQLTAQGWGKYDLVLTVAQSGHTCDSSQLALSFNRDIYRVESMQQFLGYFSQLLCQAAAQPEILCKELSLLSDEQARQLQPQQQKNPTAGQSITSVINEIFDAQPERLALYDGKLQLSYAQLKSLTDLLAKQIIHSGVGREEVVALYMGRSLLQSLTILAILKAGAAYLVLDNKHPSTRLEAIAKDAGVSLLLSDGCVPSGLEAQSGRVLGLSLEGELLQMEGQSVCELPDVQLPHVEGQQLAYMIYTSGSTGTPKGVQVEHQHVVHLILQQSLFDFTPDDRWSVFHSYAFDFSVWETFGAWMTGGAVRVVPAEVGMDSQQFARLLQQSQISVLNQTPGAFYALLEQLEYQGWPQLSLRTVIFGGEALQPSRLTLFRQHYPDVRLVNMYGITETTVHVTFKEIGERECQLGQSNIGKPLAGYGVLLVDEQLNPVAPGVPGEMLITGHGVSRGYYNRPELNRRAFITLPGVEGRVFRSGDLARRTPDGELIYLGRKDAQVQLRGFRIELGEIEQVLLSHPAIKNAAALLVKHEVAQGGGDDHAAIISWLIPEPGQDEMNYEQMVSWLGERLTEYMIPSGFYLVDEIPLNHNGKVDRKALLSRCDRPVSSALVESSEHEIDLKLLQELEAIWCEVLELDGVASRDNFFEIGGHSLKANSALLRIRERLCPAMTLKDFFSHPHFLVQASLISELLAAESSSDWPELEPLATDAHWSPSFAQQRLWLVQQQNQQDTSYNSVGMFTIHRSPETPDFETLFTGLSESFKQLVARHDVLRTHFLLDGGELTPRLGEHKGAVLSRVEGSDIDLQLLKLHELHYPFDLEKECLIRASLIKSKASDKKIAGYLLINMHHIVSDGASVVVMMNELSRFYQNYFEPGHGLPPSLPVQYQDFAAWQQRLHRQGALDEQIGYWQQIFADTIPQLELPTDRPRPLEPDHVGGMHICRLGEPLSASLRELAQQQQCTLFMLLTTISQLMLVRHSRQSDLVIGTPVIGRDHVALEPLIGFFLNLLPLRLRSSEQQTLAQLLSANQRVIAGALANQQLAFDQLLDAVGYRKQAGRHALFDVQVILQNNPPMALDFGNCQLELHPEQSVSAKFDLNIMFSDEADIELQLEYATELYDAAHTKAMMKDIVEIARILVELPIEEVSVQELLASCSSNRGEIENIDVKPVADRSLISSQIIEEEDW